MERFWLFGEDNLLNVREGSLHSAATILLSKKATQQNFCCVVFLAHMEMISSGGRDFKYSLGDIPNSFKKARWKVRRE